MYNFVKHLRLYESKKGMIMNMDFEKKIGKNIRNLREKRGFTQELLSIKLQLQGCDITRSALAKIEVGQRHLYVDELYLIKEILGCTFEEIYQIET